MFFDLNVPVPSFSYPNTSGGSQLKKGKGKQQQQGLTVTATYPPAQISAIEGRVDLLTRLGYTVIAFNQTINKQLEAKSHVNVLDGLLAQLKKRVGVIFLKRLTVILDEDSEKGFGFTNTNAAILSSYDLLSLIPTTAATLALACLSHTAPSPFTAHIISLPLTLPRLPFHIKHTMVRTALKNGAVFELAYTGALGGEGDAVLVQAGAAEDGATAKRNWWAAAREVVRVTKGRGLVVSGGVVSESDTRAPRDVANLISLLGLPQDAAHAASTKTPKLLVLRAQTRKTYRAVFSEPTVVIPQDAGPNASFALPQEETKINAISTPSQLTEQLVVKQGTDSGARNPRKRSRDLESSEAIGSTAIQLTPVQTMDSITVTKDTEKRKKKKKKGGEREN